MPLPLLAIGAGAAGVGLLGKAFNQTPDFTRLMGDYGINGDYSYDAKTDFGQGTAQENMQRYGFQGIYQKYLSSETDRMKQDEMRRIQKLASGMVPGQAALRSGVASQGAGGAVSNVIAKQQREQGMGKALDEAGQQFEASSARLDNSLFQATTQNEALRFGSSQDYMKAVGYGTQAENQESEFNQKMMFGRDTFNQDQLLKRDMFNTQGEFNQEKGEYDKWNGIFDDIGSVGVDMMFMGMNPGGPGGDVIKGGIADGRGGFDFPAKTSEELWGVKPRFGRGNAPTGYTRG